MSRIKKKQRKMFRNNYQGGAVVEIFSGQGKDPVAKWKLSGGPSAIYKEYNKEVKGFVYCLEGSSQTVKMQMPESGKTSLGLLQRFLVLQVKIPQCKDFSVELVITDSEHLKRRLHLSTVHKELSATLLHAKIPFVGLKRNIWSTLCLDLVSFTAELFKGFLALDGITLFATCKVRRIFTMKTEPPGMSDDDMFLSGAGFTDLIPRSCHFPPDVNHITQMLNMENLHKAEMRTGFVKSECAHDQSGPARSTSYRQTTPQSVLQTASGSKASGQPPQPGGKSNAASDGMDRKGSSFGRRNQKVSVESQSIAKLSDNLSHGEPYLSIHGATPGRLQSHPLTDKQGSRKLQALSAERKRLPSSDAVPGHRRQRNKTGQKCTPPCSGKESRQQPLILTEKTKDLTAGEAHICCEWEGFKAAGSSSKRTDEVSAAKEISRTALNPAQSPSCSIRPGLSSDLQVWSSWESNEGSEPQLSLQEDVFIFSSQPHSPKRGQGQGDQEKMEMGDDHVQSRSGRRYEVQPEDDFIGSESDEDKSYATFQQQRPSVESNPVTPRTPKPSSNVNVKIHCKSHKMDQMSPKELSPATSVQMQSSSTRRVGPTRCLSPKATLSKREHKCGPWRSETGNQVLDGNSSVALSRRFLQEVKLSQSSHHKEEDNNKLKPVDPSRHALHLLGSLRKDGDDDEELQMLASLKREQEEDECIASGLSASQIHQCNVSISMSSDDTSTWTHISMPANQGHHYQSEINPLLHSNPREWMDVLSPPIMPLSQRRRSGDNTWNNKENQIGGGDEAVNEEGSAEEYLNLFYDPCLNCYFDPQTGKYYELA